MQTVKDLFALAATAMELAGVAIILVGVIIASAQALFKRVQSNDIYSYYRRRLGRSIILGLEFFIAGDIIRTVAVSHTLESVGVLGVIVLIRAFLSVTLEAEIEGRLPWQPRRSGG
jgi:uncharacterized membrane protein